MSRQAAPTDGARTQRACGRRALARGVSLLALSVLIAGLAACTRQEPTAQLACPQLPVDVVRSVAVDLSPVPATAGRAPDGPSESGTLSAARQPLGTYFAYRCNWPSAKNKNEDALSVHVRDSDMSELSMLEAMMAQVMAAGLGKRLTLSLPGHGQVTWNAAGPASASWLCSTSHTDVRRLSLSIKTPRGTGDPEAAAETLLKALIPRIGCTGEPKGPTTPPGSPSAAPTTP